MSLHEYTRMKAAFKDKAAQLKARCSKVTYNGLKVGLEAEFATVDAITLNPVMQEIRDKIISECGEAADVELGAHQLELHTDPIDLHKYGFKRVIEDYRQIEASARKSAHCLGATLLRCGLSPFPEHMQDIRRTDMERYRLVPGWHDQHRNDQVITTFGKNLLNIGRADIIGLANSIQPNIQAPNLVEAINMTNLLYSYMPEIIAISGNARYCGADDLGWDDARMPMWERSHDTRDILGYIADEPIRVGLPANYYSDIDDYFEDAISQPFIIANEDATFDVGIGLLWRDVRIKFPGDIPVVEFRPISIQPTPKEDIAVLALVVGILGNDDLRFRSRRPINVLVNDREEAMHRGLKGRLHVQKPGGTWELVSAAAAAKTVIDAAALGLFKLGLAEESTNYLELLYSRLATGNPSDCLAKKIEELAGRDIPLHSAIQETLAKNCSAIDGEML